MDKTMKKCREFFSLYEIKRTCNGCNSLCCNAGVILSKNEKETIEGILEANRSCFTKEQLEGIEKTIKGYKTNTRTSDNLFGRTCIFNENNRCKLELFARENNLDPWQYKPSVCWLFPLYIKDNDKIMPSIEDEDTMNYLSLLACGSSTFKEKIKIYHNKNF